MKAGIDVDKDFPGLESGTPLERGTAFNKAYEAVKAKSPDSDRGLIS